MGLETGIGVEGVGDEVTVIRGQDITGTLRAGHGPTVQSQGAELYPLR